MKTQHKTKKASASQKSRKNDPDLNWAMYNPEKANPKASVHSPLPWRIMEMHGESTVFDTGAPTLICRCGSSLQAQARWNAAYIVRCVNNAEALAEALRRILRSDAKLAIGAQNAAQDALANWEGVK